MPVNICGIISKRSIETRRIKVTGNKTHHTGLKGISKRQSLKCHIYLLAFVKNKKAKSTCLNSGVKAGLLWLDGINHFTLWIRSNHLHNVAHNIAKRCTFLMNIILRILLKSQNFYFRNGWWWLGEGNHLWWECQTQVEETLFAEINLIITIW